MSRHDRIPADPWAGDKDEERAPARSENMLESLLATELEVPWHANIVPTALAAILIGVWLLSPVELMRSWAVSREALHQGHSATLLLHMFAHGGLLHVLLNAAALVVVGPRLIASIGTPPVAWARFAWIFLGSGMAGAAAFLILEQQPEASALGASGAIFGLLGALARIHPAQGTVVAILSRRSWLLARMFVRDHLVMFVVIAAAVLLTGQSAMVAWQAHLGGVVFGLFVAPIFLPRASRNRRRASLPIARTDHGG